MSMLTVATHFEAIGELAEGLADRVEDGRIVLYGPDAYEEGDSIGFEILLVDGTQAVHGRGMVVECIDGGEERDPEVRFDVVLAGLDLEGASEAVFERMLEARGEVAGEPAAGDAGEPDAADAADAAEAAPDAAWPEAAPAEAAPAPEAPPEPAAVEPAADFGDEATTVGTLEDAHAIEAAALAAAAPAPAPEPPAPEPEPEAPAPEALAAPTPEPESDPLADEPEAAFESSSRGPNVGPDAGRAPAEVMIPEVKGLAPPAAPPNPGGFEVVLDLVGDKLARASRDASAQLIAPDREPSTESTGAFQYGGPVPIPSRPPRPAIDPANRVARAPAMTTEEAYREKRASLGFTPPAPGETPRYVAPAAASYVESAPSHAADPADFSDVAELPSEELPLAEEAVDADGDLDVDALD